jgi:hypothetical protein
VVWRHKEIMRLYIYECKPEFNWTYASSQEFHLVPIALEVVYRKLRDIHVPGYSVRR